MALSTLSKLLELPQTLTADERNACVMIANHHGVNAAQKQAEFFMQRHSFLPDYTPINDMPDRARVLQALSLYVTAAFVPADNPKNITIECKEPIGVDDLIFLFNMLQPAQVTSNEEHTLIYLDWN